MESVCVSIIVPVHNNSKYIRETLNSIKSQTFTDYEVICVDDGSTDDSREIICEFTDSDSRFRYIYQENAGAGPARNNGIHNAKGTYLAFLDGDDLYKCNYLEEMITSIKKTSSEVCICEKERFNSKTGEILNTTHCFDNFKEMESYSTDMLAGVFFQIISMTCWDKVFLRSFVDENGFEFQSLPNSNDVSFVLSNMACANRICFVKKPQVQYRVGTGVSTQDQVKSNPLCALIAYDEARTNVYKRHINDIRWKRSIDTRCVEAFFNSFQRHVYNEELAYAIYKEFADNYEYKWDLKEKNIGYYETKIVQLKMLCYKRADYKKLKWALSYWHVERGTKPKNICIRLLALLWIILLPSKKEVIPKKGTEK